MIVLKDVVMEAGEQDLMVMIEDVLDHLIQEVALGEDQEVIPDHHLDDPNFQRKRKCKYKKYLETNFLL